MHQALEATWQRLQAAHARPPRTPRDRAWPPARPPESAVNPSPCTHPLAVVTNCGCWYPGPARKGGRSPASITRARNDTGAEADAATAEMAPTRPTTAPRPETATTRTPEHATFGASPTSRTFPGHVFRWLALVECLRRRAPGAQRRSSARGTVPRGLPVTQTDAHRTRPSRRPRAVAQVFERDRPNHRVLSPVRRRTQSCSPRHSRSQV